ncbi:MAG: hypothetical protein KBS60_05420 [Phascolarctobacterium sp.]|nr:hypothetical protein [Candidatus Phascolarctobacterium caballi]
MSSEERCLLCGEVIPEGTQVCKNCIEKYDIKATEAAEMAEELRDVANVLKITEATDANIRTSMEAILNIADRLERKNNGKKRG